MVEDPPSTLCRVSTYSAPGLPSPRMTFIVALGVPDV